MIARLAAFTHLPVHIEPAIGTVRAEVMEHLHHGNAQSVQGIEQGRRDQGVDVVDEGDVGLEVADRAGDIADGTLRIDGFA